MDQKPMRSLIKDGPSLRDFLASPATDVGTNEDPVPYMQDVRGENQKGFSDPPLYIVLYFMPYATFSCCLTYTDLLLPSFQCTLRFMAAK